MLNGSDDHALMMIANRNNGTMMSNDLAFWFKEKGRKETVSLTVVPV